MRLSSKIQISAFLIFALLSGATALAAPPKKRKPAATPAPEQTVAATGETASIRLWKEDFGGKRMRLELQIKGGKEAAIRFEPPASGPHFTEYALCPAGAVMVTFLPDESDTEKPEPVPVTLAPGTFTTLLWRQRNGASVLEVIDDTPVGTDPASAELTVRNFAPALVEIRVQAGDSLTARMRAPAAFLNIRGLDRSRCQIDTVTRDAAGKESSWTTEIDFKTCPKGTLLIFADPYGRIRPRVVPDGQPPLGTAATK